MKRGITIVLVLLAVTAMASADDVQLFCDPAEDDGTSYGYDMTGGVPNGNATAVETGGDVYTGDFAGWSVGHFEYDLTDAYAAGDLVLSAEFRTYWHNRAGRIVDPNLEVYGHNNTPGEVTVDDYYATYASPAGLTDVVLESITDSWVVADIQVALQAAMDAGQTHLCLTVAPKTYPQGEEKLGSAETNIGWFGDIRCPIGMRVDADIIPEPMTLALLAISGLAALIRRRR